MSSTTSSRPQLPKKPYASVVANGTNTKQQQQQQQQQHRSSTSIFNGSQKHVTLASGMDIHSMQSHPFIPPSSGDHSSYPSHNTQHRHPITFQKSNPYPSSIMPTGNYNMPHMHHAHPSLEEG